MHLRHVASQTFRRLLRRYPFLRHVSLTSAVLTLVWFYILYHGERSTFASHIEACQWDTWEQWPKDAAPHRLVFVADPQLVDPHTYPGRPWPLDSLTETYTDMYMARNFRLINHRLDPDSVVFLGDLFDGGREWATKQPRPLTRHQRAVLEKLGILGDTTKRQEADVGDGAEAGAIEGDEQNSEERKRSMDTYHGALARPHKGRVTKEDHNMARDGETDLRAFVQGENGRWAKWGIDQWDTEFDRFGKIFFAPEQLYPHANRFLLATSKATTDPIALYNGAHDVGHSEYGISGGKHRRVLTSLPGNHDLGFGARVQLTVRDRFHSHFGETNRIDIIGNHTFISADTPSYSAYSQFLPDGETSEEARNELVHIWQPVQDFLDDLSAPVAEAINETLRVYYPREVPTETHFHGVTETVKTDDTASKRERAVQSKSHMPVVLLSHVPLFRNPEVDCGEFREKGRAIPISAGYQYQNVLTSSLSTQLVRKVAAAGNIAHVFSGDDHDYCDVTHRFNIEDESSGKADMKTIREITAKSFSWAMGVRLPGFQLVSLWNPVDKTGRSVSTSDTTIQSHLCLLPDQLSIFIRYGTLLGITLTILLIHAIIVALRTPSNVEPDADEPETPTKSLLPRFRSRLSETPNGAPNSAQRPPTRHRASSTSTSTTNGHNPNNLSVQRSYTARTRSVSPGVGLANIQTSTPTKISSPAQRENGTPLIEKAGYYPQLRWEDPGNEHAESDEESHVGDDDGLLRDSQAKWKRRRRLTFATGKVWRGVVTFWASVVFVAVPSGLFYAVLIKNG